eukprot:4103772-Pleurochrysis_carterae.AAC.1
MEEEREPLYERACGAVDEVREQACALVCPARSSLLTRGEAHAHVRARAPARVRVASLARVRVCDCVRARARVASCGVLFVRLLPFLKGEAKVLPAAEVDESHHGSDGGSGEGAATAAGSGGGGGKESGAEGGAEGGAELDGAGVGVSSGVVVGAVGGVLIGDGGALDVDVIADIPEQMEQRTREAGEGCAAGDGVVVANGGAKAAATATTAAAPEGRRGLTVGQTTCASLVRTMSILGAWVFIASLVSRRLGPSAIAAHSVVLKAPRACSPPQHTSTSAAPSRAPQRTSTYAALSRAHARAPLTHERARALTHARTRALTHARARALTHARARPFTHASALAFARTNARALTHILPRAGIRSHTCARRQKSSSFALSLKVSLSPPLLALPCPSLVYPPPFRERGCVRSCSFTLSRFLAPSPLSRF